MAPYKVKFLPADRVYRAEDGEIEAESGRMFEFCARVAGRGDERKIGAAG